MAHFARWGPNVILGLFGIAALVWRARFSERQLPHQPPLCPAPAAGSMVQRCGGASRRTPGTEPERRRGGPFSSPGLPGPGLLDRYVSRLYLRVVALSFLALLGLFYISTFIDASDKLFKGVATGTMVMQLLMYQTPQFVYFVIPDCGAPERARHLRNCSPARAS